MSEKIYSMQDSHCMWLQSGGDAGKRAVFNNTINGAKIDFSGRFLNKAIFRNDDLSGVNFNGAELSGVVLGRQPIESYREPGLIKKVFLAALAEGVIKPDLPNMNDYCWGDYTQVFLAYWVLKLSRKGRALFKKFKNKYLVVYALLGSVWLDNDGVIHELLQDFNDGKRS